MPLLADIDRVSAAQEKPPRKIRLRYTAICASCSIAVSKGVEAIWDSSSKTVTCLACSPSGAVTPGEAGASAAAEGARRTERRVEEVRRKYGDHAAYV